MEKYDVVTGGSNVAAKIHSDTALIKPDSDGQMRYSHGSMIS